MIDFLWEQNFLGVRDTRATIEVAPAATLLPYASAFRLRRHPHGWNGAHPDAEACLFDSN